MNPLLIPLLAVTISEHTVRVPEFHANPKGAAIELAVVRVGRSETRSKSAHVILAGGPGDSGVRLVRDMAERGGESFFERFDGDVIGIDQRGTGKSLPNLQSPALYGLPLDRPGSPELWLPLIEKACREVAADFRKRGIRLEAYNTIESADDIEDVRRALGYERITLWGRSYGSHLALATLRRHPDVIERVIVANPEGPNDTFKLPSRVDAVLEKYDARSPGLIATMRKVLDRLEREPQVVDGVAIGKFDLQLLTAQALGDPRTAATLPEAYREMERGDFHRLAQLARMQRSRMGVQSAMKQMMDLSSGATAARRAQIVREAASSLLGNAINFPQFDLANAWGRPDLGDAYRAPVRSKVPVLVLAGELDPRTPVENGEEIVRHLEHGRLVVVPNAGHTFDVWSVVEKLGNE